MEFKGTKGKWLVNRMDDTFINSENKKSVLCIQHNGCYDYKELPYNALLISKAPEMLDMLKECKLQLEYLNEKFIETGTTNSLLSKIELLIKQATEL